MITGLQKKLFIVLTTLMAVLLALVSIVGAFYPPIYAKESLSFRTQGMGQDIFNLFFVLPLLIVTAIMALRGKTSALILWGGAALYLLYSFIIYCFALHFNILFLAYCALMGSAFYSVLLFLNLAKKLDLTTLFQKQMPFRGVAIFFICSALLFYLTWLKDIVPALLAGTVPQSLITDGLITNPVHILDLSLMLPALIIVAINLLKKQKSALVMASLLAVFMVLLSLAVIAMAIMMVLGKTTGDLTMIYIFSVLAIISLFFLKKIFKSLMATSKNS